jgi:PRTRC genetic system protein A
VNSRIVDHLVARDGLPPRSGLAFDYILGGDGLFVVAANPWLEVRVPVARCTVRGLSPVYHACTLPLGRLPASLWDGILRCLQVAHSAGCEVLTGVYHDGEAYRLIVPRQVVAPLAVRYEPQDNLVLEVHSHRDGLARFSATDSADEQRLRLYGVVGRLDQSTPQVALRAGAYGYFLPVPWDAVFDGDSDSIQDILNASDLGLAQEPFEGWLEPGL